MIKFLAFLSHCKQSRQKGTGHPTIKSPEEGLSVLMRFAADFRPPRPHEGYHRILFLQPSDHPAAEYTAADVTAILTRVRNAPPIVPPPPQSPGGGGRGWYGGGPEPGYRFYGHSHRPRHRHGDEHDGGFHSGGGNRGLRGRGRGARGGGGYANRYPVVYMQQEQQYYGGGGRGRGSYYGDAHRGPYYYGDPYRGDGVGVYGASPVYVAHSVTSAGSTVPQAQGSESDAGPGHASGRDDVLPIDD